MYSLKKSLVALARLLVVVAALAALLPLVGRGQPDSKNPLRRDPRKSYYLTQTLHTGSQALTACAAGYHMASLWEILDPSNLRYNTGLGYTTADSGSGPPVEFGFARTGREALGGGSIGAINCHAWTSDSALGSLFTLADNVFDGDPTPISPWKAVSTTCSNGHRVWCVQD